MTKILIKIKTRDRKSSQKNFMGGNFPAEGAIFWRCNFPWGQFSGHQFFRRQFSGGIVPGGIFPVGIFPRTPKNFPMHKTSLYIKQFFSYDINSPSAFLLKLSFITHLSH